MKIEPLERIVDPVNDPLGTAARINRNTARIERAFKNALFRDNAVDNYMEADFLMNDHALQNGYIHTYE